MILLFNQQVWLYIDNMLSVFATIEYAIVFDQSRFVIMAIVIILPVNGKLSLHLKYHLTPKMS